MRKEFKLETFFSAMSRVFGVLFQAKHPFLEIPLNDSSFVGMACIVR